MGKNDSRLTRPRDLPRFRGLPVLEGLDRLRFGRLYLALADCADSHGVMYAIRIGPQRVVLLSDPSAIECVVRERPERYRRTAMLESVSAEIRPKGVFAAEGEDWCRQRGIVVVALSRVELRDFFPKLAVTVGRLQQRWGGRRRRGSRWTFAGI